jgi:hypothetical protein
LGQFTGIVVAETTRRLARYIGNILARASLGSAHHVDATVVATALQAGGGVVATADPADMKALAGGLPGIVIEPL